MKFVDPDGNDIRLAPGMTTQQRTQIVSAIALLAHVNVNQVNVGKNGTITLTGAKNKSTGYQLIKGFINSKDKYGKDVTVMIMYSTAGSDFAPEKSLKNTGTIRYDPNDPRRSYDFQYGLAHELFHADHYFTDRDQYNKDNTTDNRTGETTPYHVLSVEQARTNDEVKDLIEEDKQQ